MLSNQDPFDDIIIPSSTTHEEQKLGKFQPKQWPKVTKQILAASNLPDTAEEILPTGEPPTQTSDLKHLVERKIPSVPCVSNFSTNTPDIHAAQESLTQLEASCAEAVISSINSEDTSLHNEKELVEVPDIGFGVDRVDDPFQPAQTTSRSAGKFQPKANFLPKNKQFATVPAAVPHAEESSIASTFSSRFCTLGAASSEVNAIQELLCESKEPEDHAEVSQDGIQVFEGDMDMQTNSNRSKEEPNATTGKTASKCQPKQCSKSVEPTHALSDFYDSTQLIPPIPPTLENLHHSSDVKCLEAVSTTVSSSAGASTSELDIINRSSNLEASLSESFFFNAEHVDSWTGEEQNLVEDVFFSMESFDEQTHPNPTLEASQGGIQVPAHDGNLQNGPDRSETEEIAASHDMVSLSDILLQPSATAVEEVGKFQPKLISLHEKGKAKSVSFMLPGDPAESIGPPECEFSFSQNERPEESACNSTGMDTSFMQMMDEESVDRSVHPSSTISDCSQDFQRDHERIGEEDASEFSGFDSLDNVIPQQTSTAAQSVGKFQPRPSVTSKDTKHSALMIRHTISKNNVGGKGECAEVSTGSGEEGESQHIDKLTEHIVGERPTSRTLEDDETDKLSRKLRKRIHMSNPSVEIDDIPNDNLDVEDSISQMDEYHSDDEYRGEDVPKSKRAPRKSKKQTEIDKQVRRRKKASEEPESVRSKSQERPNKKKFPHGTTRKRRQVDKALLEMPEDEINPRQLSIKNLILLAEAKERILNKVASVLGKPDLNVSNTGSSKDSPFGEEQGLNVGEEASHHIQQSSNKLNYHSYMNRPQSVRWSKSETELFYKAIRQFGTDFAMIQQLFPNRTRHQVKLKFKSEERKHPLQVSDALVHRSKDHSHFELVIQQLQAQAEQNAERDANIDPTATSLDAVGDYEEQRDKPNKEEKQDANFCKAEAQNPAKSDDWKSETQSADVFNEFQGVFDWDGFTL